jgi:hypothetical protein
MSLDVHVLRLPSKPISLVVAYDPLVALLDDHKTRLLNQETVTLTHLAASSAHVVKTLRIILSRRRHEGALHLCRLRSGWRRRQLNRRWRHGRLPNRLLRCNGTRRLERRPGSALTLLLLWAR